ncbi:MAG TPA: DUF4876 domain-containing protein [bacterium]|nr:DUF4876 domain-containing protein [bacterium]
MHRGKIFLSMLWMLIVFCCDKIVDLPQKPDALERVGKFQIYLEDQSGYMEKLTGRSGVFDAAVSLKSKSLGLDFDFKSDSNGVVIVENMVSDDYFVTAKRGLTPEEMELISGVATSNIELQNRDCKMITLRADVDSTIVVTMNIVSLGEQLVISEIYACGPPEAGLYYHDKYVELYNQSDSTIYLDSLLVALVSKAYPRDADYVYSKNVWMVPGTGRDHPLAPGEFAVMAEDAIDHTINAPHSVDLSMVRFEFYKPESPDIDNPNIPNMQLILQVYGYDWLIGGEKDALIIARVNPDSLEYRDEHLLIPYDKIIDGVEYLSDPANLRDKKLHESIDAGATGGIEFYTGKSMERIALLKTDKLILKDDNNSSLDFIVIDAPTPQFHHSQ